MKAIDSGKIKKRRGRACSGKQSRDKGNPVQKTDLKKILQLHISVTLFCSMILSAALILPAAGQSSELDVDKLSLNELVQLKLIPVGVGGHIHSKGEWMIGYSSHYMQMSQKDYARDKGFMVLPTSMRMQMQMAEIMYGVTNNVTIMLMSSYKRLSMDHKTLMGEQFTTTADGIGDIDIMLHYSVLRSFKTHLVAIVGVSLPTGSISQRGATPTGLNQLLSYPMQLGTGTHDVLTGLSFINQREFWSWGMRGQGRVRVGRNEHHYRFGNTYKFDIWASQRVARWMAMGLRVSGHFVENIRDADPRLNPNMVPTADPAMQAYAKWTLTPLLNFFIPSGPLKDNRLVLEGSVPIYHSRAGAFLEEQWGMKVSWQWSI